MRGAAKQVLVCPRRIKTLIVFHVELIDNNAVMNAGTAVLVSPHLYVPWRRRNEGARSSAQAECQLPLSAKINMRWSLSCEGRAATANFHCADVMRPRCALSEVIDERNHSVVETIGGFIEITTGVRIHFRRQSGCRCVGRDRARAS